jgi:4-amino-4-deoxy-L-arabinose transferase-like glycosyltransferase
MRGGRFLPCILLVVLTVGAFVPFLDKAFHIDDPLFVWCAKRILVEPLDPYGFQVTWHIFPQPMAEVMRNPPLGCCFLAAAGGLVGFSERALHAAFLIPAVAAVLATYFLARACGGRPGLSALLLLASPAYFVSATGVMCDVLMLALGLWATVAWIAGLRRGRTGPLLLAAGLLCASVLTKMNGILFLPGLLLFGLLERRRIGWWAALLLLPVAALGAWLTAVTALYGGSAFDALSLAATGQERPLAAAAAAVLLAFAGGGAIPALFGAPTAFGRKTCAVLAGAGLTTALILWFTGALRGITLQGVRIDRPLLFVQLAVLCFGGLAVVRLVWPDRGVRRSPVAVMLSCQIAVTLLFAALSAWTISARYLLTLAPAVAVLLTTAPGVTTGRPGLARRLAPLLVLLPSAAITGVVALADRDFADHGREAARTIVREHGDRGALWFQGHWGFQYYMEEAGARPFNAKGMPLRRGDLLVIPQHGANLVPVDGRVFHTLRTLSFSPTTKIATMVRDVGAGFYASLWGPLPFAFGDVPPEEYYLLGLRR